MKKSWRSTTLALIAALPLLALSSGQNVQAAQSIPFEGSWCRHWSRTVAPDYSANQSGPLAPLCGAEIGAPRPAGLKKPNVVAIFAGPTFVVTENGREVGRIEGYTVEKYFWRTLGDTSRAGISPAASNAI